MKRKSRRDAKRKSKERALCRASVIPERINEDKEEVARYPAVREAQGVGAAWGGVWIAARNSPKGGRNKLVCLNDGPRGRKTHKKKLKEFQEAKKELKKKTLVHRPWRGMSSGGGGEERGIIFNVMATSTKRFR